MYINLRTLSDYSIGKSVIKMPNLAEYCKKNGMPAVALTDSNNLFGSLEFSLECQKLGIQPIIGSLITIEYSSLDFYENKSEEKYADLLIIAKNEIGYKNLLYLISDLYLNKKYTTSSIPSIDFDNLLSHSDGLVVLCGSNNSPLEKLFEENKLEDCEKLIDLLLEKFKDNFFLELSRGQKFRDVEFEKFIIDNAISKKIPIVGTNPTQFLEENMCDSLDALMCITNNRYLVEDDRPKANKEAYFKSYRRMKELFNDIPEALENSILIAKKCSYLLKDKVPVLPKFFATSTEEREEIIKQSEIGLKNRLKNLVNNDKDKIYFERLKYELSVINNMNFGGYFLIVSDFIQWSRKNDIPVGPGRGSGAGSIVAWSLGITDIDPIEFGLLFERFLNPERISMPDFDIDFCQDRRDEVIQYVRNKYGTDKVANIITFGKLQARAVLRDVGRVLQIPYMQVDKICKMVPSNPANPITLKEAINMDKDLKSQSMNDESLRKLIEISLKLEGMNRHISTHAAGLVISDEKLSKVVPLYRDSNSEISVIQYSLKYVEKIGLVKFDFLGLKTLTVISWVCKLIKKDIKDFDISTINVNDKKTFDMLSKGHCIGVFQFESSGMREAIKKILPDKIEDLIALGSLYRPGPMDNIPSYIDRKHGKEEVDFIHPKLENVLKETYGIIVYQEQVMEIAQVLACYTLGEADLLRRAMGKKIKEEMEAQRVIFIDGCCNNGIDKSKAEEVFNLVNKFASYGFNKSHAAAYAYISYQTAYLKAHFPLQFFTASINLEIDNTDKIFLFILEAKKFNAEILLPDINFSDAEFKIESKSIRFGLSGLKGVGKNFIELICEDRSNNGDFKDIFDFCSRVSKHGLNKRILENLIKSGSLDFFAVNRHTLFMNVELLLRRCCSKEESSDSQLNLFSDISEINSYMIELQHFSEWEEDKKLQMEFEAFGYYLSSHPLEKYSEFISRIGIDTSEDIETESVNIKKLQIVGVLLSKKVRSTHKGKYAFLQISDLNGMIDLAIFNEALLYEKNDVLVEGNVLYFSAVGKRDAAGLRIVINHIYDFEDFINTSGNSFSVTIHNKEELEYLVGKINYDKGIKVDITIEIQGLGVAKFKHNKDLYIKAVLLNEVKERFKIE